MVERARLRPLERRILALTDEGVPDSEIARRFRRSEDFVVRVRSLSEVPRRSPTTRGAPGPLRPLERRILRWTATGEDHARVAARFHRSTRFVDRVEHLARYKLAR